MIADELHCDKGLRIQSWIESVPEISSPTARPVKSARRGRACSTSDAFILPYNAILPDTPSPTHKSDTSGSRERAADSDQLDDLTDLTPKPKPKTRFPTYLRSPSKRPKSSSPTKHKSRRNLELLEKPVHIKDLEGNTAILPQDVKSLYSLIQKARHKEGIIPSEVRDQVVSLVGEDEARQYYFMPEATAGAEAIYDTLYEITLEAKEAAKYEYHETGWNHFVHTPLLKLVYPSRTRSNKGPGRLEQSKQLRGARVVNVMSATIWGPYIPIKPKLLDPSLQTTSIDPDSGSVASVSIASGSFACSVSIASASDVWTDQGSSIHGDVHSRSSSKKVDYVLAMDVGSDAPLHKVLSLHLHNEAIERGLLPHVNQTLYPPLQMSPIACSIETKAAVGPQDPVLQLGIWVAAWHKRMYLLREYLVSVVPSLEGSRREERLPSTLVVEVINHEWQLYFACDQGTWIDFYGPLTIGSTRNITEIYVLIASLKAIKDWIESSFSLGMEKWLICSDR